jgi:hypothetical protein
MPSAVDTFRNEFRKWVGAHQSSPDAEPLLGSLQSKIPINSLTQIGGGLLNGWLSTNRAPGKGYYVREVGRPHCSSGMTMISRVSGGNIAPCWEYYLQLADYCQLMPVAIAHKLIVRLEDQLMDIAVWRDQQNLRLYVENKVSAATAATLLKNLTDFGQTGFNLDDLDLRNDALRKAKYIARARPEYFAIRAIDYEKLFSVTFDGPLNQFRLKEIDEHFSHPLYNVTGDGSSPANRVTDTLALALAQELGDSVWISPGSGQTTLNVYLPSHAGDSIVLGLYENGEVWTDLHKLDAQVAQHLINQLSTLNIQVDGSKEWTFWTRGGTRFRLQQFEADALALAFAESVRNVG